MTTTPNQEAHGIGVYDLDAARRAREAAPEASESTNAAPAIAENVSERAQAAHDNTDAAAEDDTETTPEIVDGQVLAVRDDRSGTVKAAPRREILPAWAKDRESAKSAAAWAVKHYGHTTTYHGVRLPTYYAKLAARSPLGLGRVMAMCWGWIFDAEDKENRMTVRGNTLDAGAYLRLREDHRRQIKARVFLAVLMLLTVAGIAAYVVYGIDSLMVQLGLGLAALAGLGLLGRNPDKPITGRAVDTAKEPRLTSDLILNALGSLGLARLNQAMAKEGAKAIAFVSPIMRDGAGFRAELDLPPGVTASEVIEQRDRLASGLRRSLGKVWPETDPEVHVGRLVLYVADKSLAQSKPAPWPLATSGKVNVFEPIPIGVDQRGRPVVVTLMFATGLIGALPRMGKTFTLRLLCLAAALDPRVELHTYNLKGGSDLGMLDDVAHANRSGDDPEDIDYLVRDLREGAIEMRRRYKAIKTLPREVCPESKVTDALASEKSLKLHPIFWAFDETQKMFEHPTHGAEIAEIVTDLVKRGPAVGIMVWLATQRPDAKSIPTGISANAVLRLCLKVMGQVENDMVLGTSMYKSGIRATTFGRKDLGIAYLVGEGDDPVIVRSSFVDAPAAEVICARARAARLAAGRLTGMAAGEILPDDDTGSILDHLLAVWPEHDPEWSNGKVWCDELAARLAEHNGSLYGGWTGEQVTAAVKPHGIRTVQVKKVIDGKQTNKRGLVRRDLTDTLGHTDTDDPDNPIGGVLAPV
ncbi:cell division protein FtsK [Nocardioides panzhihuensis]|uniref:S-DNA-T family DNA segregation ATPase FtsK/SpoIIIE n=1 Tax=Nocardioides panzhihuensis TaxID=860243 RepID=A0A7Z0IVD1_9ACTN|nr:cell division protein FtsK [Nocardioides panzhihuensis]NYI80885.1 S-DNA-T family DNA segregation ATPase FtsK/SpoIIIE [Nocardioides panzhihuensis]NYI81276.1 S-DNA-T family DNA segregation ATPase FtsK/SpoIIIE [Nocardioides panzhihuensis]NYI81313.1 S-DNA-T family DNA segregation ATPase FtsK/SpoIIIE [Nocardioides panzhihuensis]NYI81331.1 S-DNA-T family DNA segregation ATPase FtsK/SpoIIIE [Nocardioides panzhihuensis]NYI81350.1 S-DNA-T family DNA segregation ATPase FtsK/SpoIIIE [Nocardioides panz